MTQSGSKNNNQRSGESLPCGLLVMDKPQGFTSFDLCAKLRGITRQKHIGHTGTLDPMATGVMIVLLGRAARAAELIPDHTKRYTAGFRLGITTDTLDITGEVVERQEADVPQKQLEAVLDGFRGVITQLPPMYSAVHVNGERLYKLARKGIEVERQPRTVNISLLELTGYDGRREGTLDVECSKGTYIRSLIDDIGSALGCGAVMTSLRRTSAMGFSAGQAHTLEEIEALAVGGRLDEAVLPVDSALVCYRKVTVSEKQAARYRCGGALSADRLRGAEDPADSVAEGELIRVYAPDGFIGVGRMCAPKTAEPGGALELTPYKLLS